MKDFFSDIENELEYFLNTDLTTQGGETIKTNCSKIHDVLYNKLFVETNDFNEKYKELQVLFRNKGLFLKTKVRSDINGLMDIIVYIPNKDNYVGIVLNTIRYNENIL